ncbi:Rho termination factor N-terminal domain-containing protein [Telmatospirillum sp. J64-1]|uniref:Rho termination factor N-terminal domain-containing protein n=1 Tax=Telmatospirillum sp. J64-1 TaxID=2502183 RepID=UPI00115CFF00|nr:Rho termination factor N-terminal domain-containing protein [Telmatospirillum sp. J64-1]
MAQKDRPQIKDDETYEALRRRGESKEKAARIANAKAQARRGERESPSRRGGKSPAYEEWSRDDLYEKAREIGIAGRSKMNKGQLIDALRHH